MYESKDVMVSHPSHYKSKNGMEVIDVIEAFTSELKGVEATDCEIFKRKQRKGE